MRPRQLGWREHVAINIYWFGLSVSAGVITPVLLPYLVARFVDPGNKNTALAMARVIGLAAAMLAQPIAGMVSDRSSSRWGRRRPFILGGTLFDLLFLAMIGASPLFAGSPLDAVLEPKLGISTAFAVLLVGLLLLQTSSNSAQGALQGLMPDRVPQNQRGRSSGVKSTFELLPAVIIIFIGPLVDSGRIGLTVAIIGLALVGTMAITVAAVHETPLNVKPGAPPASGRVLRLVLLTAIFLGVTQLGASGVSAASHALSRAATLTAVRIGLIASAGLLAMLAAILIGVYAGVRVGVGPQARARRSFVWWIINRLLFLAAVGSVQGFAQFYLADVIHAPNPATATTRLLAVVAIFLLPAALLGGRLSDRIGRKPLVAASGLLAALGTLVVLAARDMLLVNVGGSLLGAAAGVFMATNWALGTDLVPQDEAGRYLGISNLAGAGAGIVGAGIGGPMADSFNRLTPGLGYSVIFAIYAALFAVSTLSLLAVRIPDKQAE